MKLLQWKWLFSYYASVMLTKKNQRIYKTYDT